MDKNNDCYFYYYSTCTKGNSCPFRHCSDALGSEVVCEMWRIGKCKDKQCPFRHTEPNINRALIPCWFEKQPSGCRKPHCVFQHNKPRPSVTELQTKRSEWILPIGQANGSNPAVSSPTNQNNNVPVNCNDVKPGPSNGQQQLHQQKTRQISISLDPEEESDDPDVNETPTVNNSEPSTVQVKTLEHIKLEKILNIQQSEQPELVESSSAPHLNITKKDFRRPPRKTKDSPKIEISPKNIKTEKKPEPRADFAVKTLEQIRQEREANESETPCKENAEPNLLKRANSDDGKPVKAIKLRRNRHNVAFQNQEVAATADNHQEELSNPGPASMECSGNDQNAHSNSTDESQKKSFMPDLELEFLNVVPTEGISFTNTEDFNIDDDELMRKLDQVINS